MKAARSTVPYFQPIVITLESQGEVDAMHAILNHAWITDSPQIKAAFPEEPEALLNGVISDDHNAMHRELTEFMKRKAKGTAP